MRWLLCTDNRFYTIRCAILSCGAAVSTASSKVKSHISFLLLYGCEIQTCKIKMNARLVLTRALSYPGLPSNDKEG
jgi:hypothetical protein